MSFRREKYVPKGGPDGGDGGRGGDVILVGDSSIDTLLAFKYSPHFRAKSGQPGRGKSQHGAAGDDCIVQAPLGTLVFDDEHDGELLVDISEPEQTFILAGGGKGGRGNEHFKSPTNQAPREATDGEPGEERTFRVELKLLADVGLIGKPNAGKSTMLRAISRATPKVADYPFTTLSPHLGIAELSDERRLVFADIPGLIEGAADGAGLGHDFLRHIERTSVLVHLLDVAPTDGTEPVANYKAIRGELAEYSPTLLEKPEIIVLNKIDLVPGDDRDQYISELTDALGGGESMGVTSGATGEGVSDLLEACWRAIGKHESHRGWRAG